MFAVMLDGALGETVTLAGIMGADVELFIMTVGVAVTLPIVAFGVTVTFVSTVGTAVALAMTVGVAVTLAAVVGIAVGVGLALGLDDVHPARKTVAPTIRTTITDRI